ncbi:DMT family transporter [Pyrodictium delaneyi]|uniref:EamA family transporter n=1 Tax=Pyrodictium delaneyi TaxID=1273541 RepID=A0A211YNV5_9CREN|nr:DMT family transporter [Pyrodictium delaneyi]OWJ54646.1 EamA family transporter [Pyrodictium delaneyi]
MRRLVAFLLAASAPLAWATNVVASRVLVTSGVNPFALTAVRWALAALLMVVYSLARGLGVPVGRRLLLAGLLGITMFNNLLYLALGYAPAALVGLVFGLLPAVTMLMARALGVERGDKVLAVAAVVGLAGVALLEAEGLRSPGTMEWLGVLLALADVAVWALYTIESRRLTQGLHPLAALTGSTVLSTPFNTVAALPWLGQSIAALGDPLLLSLLLYIAAVPGFLAYLAWFHAVKELGPTTTSLFVDLLPPATLLLAVVTLGEKPRGLQLAGTVMILLSLALAARRQLQLASQRAGAE